MVSAVSPDGLSPGLTVVIPTHNRPEYLRRVLTYLGNCEEEFALIVADSSTPDLRGQNRKICRDLFGDAVDYQEHSSETQLFTKHRDAAASVRTRYACMLADDDIIDVREMMRCMAFLEEHPDYSGCHGRWVGFRPLKGRYEITHVEYGKESPENDDLGARIVDYFMNYEAIFYLVIRTEVMRQSFEFALRQNCSLFSELGIGFTAVALGKVKRLDGLFAYRWPQMEFSRNFYWEPAAFVENDPETMFDDLWQFRNAALDLLFPRADPKKADRIRRAIFYGFLGYLYTFVDFRTLGRGVLTPETSLRLFENFARKPPSYPYGKVGRILRAIDRPIIVAEALARRPGAVGSAARRFVEIWKRPRVDRIDRGTVLLRKPLDRLLTEREIERAEQVFATVPYMDETIP